MFGFHYMFEFHLITGRRPIVCKIFLQKRRLVKVFALGTVGVIIRTMASTGCKRRFWRWKYRVPVSDALFLTLGPWEEEADRVCFHRHQVVHVLGHRLHYAPETLRQFFKRGERRILSSIQKMVEELPRCNTRPQVVQFSEYSLFCAMGFENEKKPVLSSRC